MSQECVVPRCGRPTSDFLCAGCVTELVTALRELAFGLCNQQPRPGLLADLQDVVTRMTVGTTEKGHSQTKAAEQPMPFHAAASELTWVADNTITAWARDFSETNRHLHPTWSTTVQAAEWMATYPNLLALHPAARELHDEITHLVGEVRRIVDRAPDKIYLGVCGMELDDVVCTDRLYGVVDRDTVRCRTCGTTHDAHQRWREVQDRVRHSLATAAEISGALAKLYGRQINVKTVRTWANRGVIDTYGRNRHGEPLHKVGQVLDTAARRVHVKKPA